MPGKSECFALSMSQQNIWDLEELYPGTSINVVSATIRIDGRLDFNALSRTLNLILRADGTLRTRLRAEDGRILQECVPWAEEIFPIYDFSLTDPEGFSHWETAMTRESMPMYDSPLCRFYLFRTGEESGGFLMKTHHIISDGWSQVLLCNRIADTYLSILSGGEPEPEPSPDYGIHISKEREYLSSRACRADETYWRELLSGGAEPVSFRQQRGSGVSPVGRRRSHKLPETLNHAIVSFCREHRVSPFAPYYMALAIAARRMGAGRRLTVGVPIHNRSDLQARLTTGMFVSTLPLVTELDEDWTGEEFNDRLSETWLDLLRHQRYPFSFIEGLPRPDSGKLFSVALSYQDNLSYQNDDTSVRFSGRWNYGGYQAEQLCIHITNLEDNRRYTVDYDYLTQLFTDAEIDRLHGIICGILSQLLAHPERPIREIDILSPEEREQVLYTFNRTEVRRAFVGLWPALCRNAELHGDRAALIDGGVKITYSELCRRAAAAAGLIKPHLSAPDRLAAVMLPRGAGLACALAGIIAAGGAWLIIAPELPPERVKLIISSSGAEVLLTSAELVSRFEPGSFSIPAITETCGGDADGFTPPGEEPSDLAYVVYTSGSTGAPKGVEITRANLANFALGMKSVFPEGAMLSVSNVSFDAFMLECAVSLLNGLTVVFADERQQEDPAALAGLLTGCGVDYLCMTPSRLEAYMESPAFRLALKDRRGILCGGEAFSGDLLRKLRELTNAHIYNQYGPSETTVGVSMSSLDAGCAITVGKPMPNCFLYVLDDRLQPLPAGVFGELFIGGESVGRGYRGAPELTEKAFLPDPFVTGGRMYRSGDAAGWTPDGNIRLRGRLDRQVKIRGQRAEPDELVFCLQSHPAVRKAAAKAVEVCGQSVLCAYCCADDGTTESELMRYLGERLPVYLLPCRVVMLDAMPMTASGKVDEKALPAPEITGGGAAPETAVQEKILGVFRDVLGRPELGSDGDYFLFGGNSLNAMEAIGRLEDVLGRRIRISDLYACRTAKRLDEWMSGGKTKPQQQTPFAKAPAAESYPASDIQQSIFVQCGMDPTGLSYNMPGAFRMGFEPDAARLESAFRALIDGDELYRTAFILDKGGLTAHVLPQVPFELPVLEGGDAESAWRSFLKPFDLSSPPLMRAALWHRDDGGWVLMTDIHHIVGDGVSTSVMLRRLDTLYSGAPCLPEYTYRDYCAYMAALDGERSAEAWKERLSPLPEPLDLPTDMPRPHPFDFRGQLHAFSLPQSTAEACRRLCRQRELTPFMLFSAAFGLLLGRISGKSELMIGTPVSGRTRSELWDICGPFISTLPLRINLQPGQNAEDYLGSVKRETLWVLEHQQLPVDRVLAELGVQRQFGENPLYQVMFTYRPLDVGTLTFGGMPVDAAEAPHSTAKMDLCLEGAESGGGFSFTLEYASSLFSPETAAFYARCFVSALDALAGGGPLAELDILPAEDRLRLITEPSQTVTPFRRAKMDELFSEQARRTPDAPAVVFRGESVSYAALRRRAACLSSRLRAAGVEQGGTVGLCCRRGPDIFAGMLAILENGCAYMPFLSDFPRQRIEYMLSTAAVSAVLCSPDCIDTVSGIDGVPVIPMDGGEAEPTLRSLRGGLTYVLFTSGSTGRPKGVMVSDRAVANYRANVKKVLEISDGPVLCLANMTFDIFMTEGLLPLTMGRTVVLADEEERALPWRTAKLITDSGVKTVQITPSQLRVCLGSEDFRAALKSVRLLIITGEASSRSLVDAVSDVTDAVLVDLYGPTETTVYASGSRLEKGGRVTIGKPFENCRMYVLDEKGELALPTARGELYIAGECLSDGYVNRPDLTEKAFSADPFFPGELMYRTGDLARLLTDGSFECLGRADSQVKLNGLRIELDEINGAAVQSGLVSECVTLLCRKSDGTSFLRSFAVPAAGADGGEAALRLEMGKLLPAYMIPAQFVMLDSLPVNPSGKIDMPRLSAWEAEEPAPVRAESVSSVSETLRGVWRDALERSDISDTESFFLQGGTSLAALAVLTGYYEQGLSMTLADFYAHPTLAEQEAMLKAAPAAPGANAVPKAENTAVETFVPHPAPSDVPPAPSLPARRVLVTGASGFLGAHLVRELLRCGADTVTCLMRDGDRARLLSVLVHYFGPDWGADNSWRINVVRGSVTSLRFGMPERDYAALMSCVDAVFHSAADVRHYSSDGRALDTNVAGTVNAADFASLAGVPFNHISTLSVSGEYMLRDPALAAVFTESDFDIGQNWEDNIYVRGKFLAEQAVYDRVRRGLCARVYRLGRLVGRDSDGMFQPNPKTNAVYLTLRGIQAAGAIPEAMAGQQIDLTPIDFCAGAITALSSSDMPVCHIADPAPVTMLEAVSAIKPDIRVASDGEFSALLSQAARNGRASDVAPLIEVWNRAIRSGPAKITPVWDRTTKKLRSLGAAMPASGPELRLKEYTVNFEGGKVKE